MISFGKIILEEEILNITCQQVVMKQPTINIPNNTRGFICYIQFIN